MVPKLGVAVASGDGQQTFRATEVRLAGHQGWRAALGWLHAPDDTTLCRFLRCFNEAVQEYALEVPTRRRDDP